MENRYLTVSALNKYLKLKFDTDKFLIHIYLKGEISDFKISNNNYYFSVKDNQMRIKAIMFDYAPKISFQPKNGDKVLLEGQVTIYEALGVYQIYVSKMTLDGIGEQFLQFEQLKKELDRRGFFAKKRPLPPVITHLGLITSATGAVIQDIINTINRRCPLMKIFLYPTIMQGEKAVSSVIKNIMRANEDRLSQVIIIARGGGSFEDLAVFNTKEIALAVYDSQIPVISAIGHETDVTICDFVADMRVATPTVAAEVVSRNKEELRKRISFLEEKIFQIQKNIFYEKKRKFEEIANKLSRLSPNEKFLNSCYRFQKAETTLNKNFKSIINLKEIMHQNLLKILDKINLNENIIIKGTSLLALNKRSFEIYNKKITDLENSFFISLAKLKNLNPLKVMERGFAIVKHNGMTIKSANNLKNNDVIEINFADGKKKASILEE